MSMRDRRPWLDRMRRDVTAVMERDPAARTWWEVAALYPGVHAVWAHRVSHTLWNRGAHFSARALSQAARWATGIEIHPAARIGDGLVIDHGSGVVIGETAEIGNDVTIYQGVTLGGRAMHHGKRHPTVGDRVLIGAGARLLGDIEVGSDSRIGANAVLVRSVAPNSTVVGVPARQIPAADNTPQAAPEPVDDYVI